MKSCKSKKNIKIMLIGGLPRPSGGVTVFLGRLVNSLGNRIDFSVLDSNPGEKEPTLAKEHKISPQNRFIKIIWTLKNIILFNGNLVHFNYSKARSLFFFLFIPKLGKQFYLTLHHGSLLLFAKKSGHLKLWLLRQAAKRIDLVFSLCDDHLLFYQLLKISDKKIIQIKPYISPPKVCNSFSDNDFIDKKSRYDNAVIASGHVDVIYNYDYIIKYLNEHQNCFATFFFYGRSMDYNYIDYLKSILQNPDQVKFFFNEKETTFLSALKSSDAFLRPNSIDSWGASVADACTLGVPAIASDVCERHPKAILFKAGDYKQFSKKVELSLTFKPNTQKNNYAGMEELYYKAYRKVLYNGTIKPK